MVSCMLPGLLPETKPEVTKGQLEQQPNKLMVNRKQQISAEQLVTYVHANARAQRECVQLSPTFLAVTGQQPW